MSRQIYRFVLQRSQRLSADPRNAGLLADAHALGLMPVTGIQCHDLYFIEGELPQQDLRRLAIELLGDPVAQTSEWRSVASDGVASVNGHVIETALRPGVTDPVAEQIIRAAHELGIRAVTRAATGNRYLVGGRLTVRDLHTLANRVLANPVIQRYAIGEIEPVFPEPAEASGHVDAIAIRELGPDELLALSRDRRAALDLAEMQTIQNYYRTEGREPTDVEFEMIAQTWSEHCVHKTFKAKIEVRGQKSEVRTDNSDLGALTSDIHIDGLLKTYIRSATEKIAAPWVRSAFVDNAGIIDFDDDYEVSFKVETHNHPSAIEPFGGANTGVGGVIRDILGVSAKPIAATDVLCFGAADLEPKKLPEGVLHPRRIRSGVVAGIQDYGNKIGIPTVNGAILYDEGYTANPLVFCGCVGLAPKGKHAAMREPKPGDRVIVLGGRTGRDGLRGATFSSMTMDAQTGEVAGASVQIGDPITEKGLIEVITRARDLGQYNAITDCGAGGLSSAVGEMAGKIGADVELTRVRLKYPGLAPWEIWLSEAQERMVLAVPESALAQLQILCDTYNVELTDFGEFTNTGRLVVRYDGRIVLDLANNFLHDGLPQRRLVAHILPSPATAPRSEAKRAGGRGTPEKRRGEDEIPAETKLLRLLASPNIASKATVIRVYDHEILGGTVVKPLTGAKNDGPSDACVIKPIGTKGSRGLVISNGINPGLGKVDPYYMALSVVDEAIRNAVAVGADPGRMALLDNFCWGDPGRPETLGALVEAARGCHDAALHYGTPFISGKDSLNNEYLGPDGQRHAIPPTLLISAIGIIEDVSKAVTMDLKEAGNMLYLIGEIHNLQSSISSLTGHLPLLYRRLHHAMQVGLVRSCHDLSEGGLAVAAAEMCIGGRLGLSLTLDTGDIFAEVNGCLLAEVRSVDCITFESMLDGLPFQRIGLATAAKRLNISTRNETLLSVAVRELVAAFNSPVPLAKGMGMREKK
ncbi:MAG: phosphoribosylformylglycinamidine synthase subunit PurL [Chloroflexota bacterium]